MMWSPLMWRLRRGADGLGLPGLAGAGLLAFCAIFYFSAFVPASREVQSLGHEADAMRTRTLSTSELFRRQPAGQLDTFYKNFIDMKGMPDALEPLHQAAATQDISLERGEYNLVRSDSDKLVRYEMTLPVRSDYTHIRKFLSQLLATVPQISLDSVDFERQKIGDTAIDAQIKLTLYLLDKR